MLRTTASLLLLGGLVYAQNSTYSNVSSTACPSPGGAHIIVARGSNEKPGYGIEGAVKQYVLDHLPGSTAEALDYTATISNYFNSEDGGIVAMRQAVNNYVNKCSACLPLVIIGFSQGAQVSVAWRQHCFLHPLC